MQRSLYAVRQHIRRFDILKRFLARTLQSADLALILMEQRHRADQREILAVFAPGAGLVVEEGEMLGAGVDHVHGFEEPLGIVMQCADTRLIRLPEVQHRVGLGRSTIYRWMSEGKFPEPLQLGGYAVAWSENDIDAWITTRYNWRIQYSKME